jgi:hypothetical protein
MLNNTRAERSDERFSRSAVEARIYKKPAFHLHANEQGIQLSPRKNFLLPFPTLLQHINVCTQQEVYDNVHGDPNGKLTL